MTSVLTTSLAFGAAMPRSAIAQSAPSRNVTTSTLSMDAEAEAFQVAQSYTAARLCPADLGAVIDSVINQPSFASAQWGILVKSLNSGEVLYSHNADEYFIPASNIKLLTTATALQLFDQRNFGAYTSWLDEIRTINRDSDNYLADSLFRNLGGQPRIQTVMETLGVDPYGFRQVDGSGLSRYNMVQPTTLVALLEAMQTVENRDLFYQSLPVAGMTGTLRSRFSGTVAQGRVRAKTGTLRGVRALSGYMDAPSGESVVFSILINQPGQSGSVMLDAIDTIVMRMTQLEACE
ncbi:MAG: D-alanyl-D-alanine carboxypeptidase/D-alanyl-D-alanine endopeptidase [Thainema sp.]